MTEAIETPVSQQDVYNPYDDPTLTVDITPWSTVVSKAREAGKQFARPHTPGDNGVYPLSGTRSLVQWNDLPAVPPVPKPEAPERDLFTTVMDYLNSPERSERTVVFNKLNAAGFFGNKTDEQRAEAVRTVLKGYEGTCRTGAERAKLALGDLLPETVPSTKTVRAVIDLTVEGNVSGLSGQADNSVTGNAVAILVQNKSQLCYSADRNVTAVRWRGYEVIDDADSDAVPEITD